MPAPVPLEQALVGYLVPLVSVPVATRVPNPRPPAFVRVTRVGGGLVNMAQSQVQVLAECWGETDTLAWGLASLTWSALHDSPLPDSIGRGVEVMAVDVGEPVNFPDTASGVSRYQFLASMTVNLIEESP